MAAPVAADADEPSYDPLQDVLGDIEPSDEHYKLFPKPISGCRNLDELARHVRSPEYKQLRDKPELHIPGLTDVNEPALADTVATTARVQVKFASKLSRALVRYAGAVMFSCVFLTVGPILVGGKSGPLHESVKTAWLSVAERLDTEAGQAELLCPTGSPHRIDEVLVEVKQLATKLGGPDATLGSIPAIFRAAGQPDSSAKAVSLACATVCALMVLIWASHDVFVLGLEPLGERSVYKDVRLLHGHAACLMGAGDELMRRKRIWRWLRTFGFHGRENRLTVANFDQGAEDDMAGQEDVSGKWYISHGKYWHDIVKLILYILKFQRWECGRKLRLAIWRAWLIQIGVPVTAYLVFLCRLCPTFEYRTRVMTTTDDAIFWTSAPATALHPSAVSHFGADSELSRMGASESEGAHVTNALTEASAEPVEWPPSDETPASGDITSRLTALASAYVGDKCTSFDVETKRLILAVLNRVNAHLAEDVSTPVVLPPPPLPPPQALSGEAGPSGAPAAVHGPEQSGAGTAHASMIQGPQPGPWRRVRQLSGGAGDIEYYWNTETHETSMSPPLGLSADAIEVVYNNLLAPKD